MAVLGGGRRGHHLLLPLLLVAGVAFLAGFMASVVINFQSSKEVFTELAANKENPGVFLKSAINSEVSSLPQDLFTFQNKCSEAAPWEGVRSLLLNELFDGISPFDGFPPPHIAAQLRGGRIKGWGSHARVFEDLLREVRPRLVVELGTFLGASAIHIANLSRSLGLQTLILCVDDFRGWPGFHHTFKDIHQEHGQALLYYQFLQNVVSTNLSTAILPLPFSTTSAISKLCELGVQADLIEVDAGHDFHSAWADINWAWALLKPQTGIMFGHDYYLKADNRGVGRAVHLFARLKGLKVQPHGRHWILRRPSPSKSERVRLGKRKPQHQGATSRSP